MEHFYKELFEDTMRKLLKEQEEREKERMETIVKTVELQPLRNNSTYIVKFDYDITPDIINSYIGYLNKQGEKNQIIFIPSHSKAEIGDSI